MNRIKSTLLFSAASLAVVGAANAADLPIKKAAPIEYVRVCGAYGAGFFYIPGTETCLRVSGRARYEVGYSPSYYNGNGTGGNANQGDTVGYRGLLRLNLDARTQTAYGTLRAFVRLEGASRTGATQGLRSGTQERIGNAFGATGQDQTGRVQQYMNVDKAFIQFAGLTAGRASSFFDFYAHDFEIMASTAGSDVQSTNLLAYTYKFDGTGLSATLSMEDPAFRRNGIYSPDSQDATYGRPYRVFVGTNAAGAPVFQQIDVAERSRMPDFVGVVRYDAPWGSAQLSGAVKEINVSSLNYATIAGSPAVATVGGTITGAPAVNFPAGFLAAQTPYSGRANSEYGFAVQGGVKVNAPFIAPGDALYLQGAYGEGATLYTGYSSQHGSYTTNVVTLNGAPFNAFIADATVNPFTGKINTSESFTVAASYLHYWAPEWRSAFFASYGEINFAKGAREFNYLAYQSATSNSANANFVGFGGLGSRSFALSPVLRDNYQIIAGASLIWSPVKDLDIGVEGLYLKNGIKNGRVVDQTSLPVSAAAINAGAFVKTVDSADSYQARFRVQRDF